MSFLVSSPSVVNPIVDCTSSLPVEYVEPRWYVAQTRARHEKRVAEQLEQKGIECFLPLYEAVSQWKQRRVRLKLPLFAGYVFVCLPLCERMRALQIRSVVRLVGFGALPVALPDDEVEAMRNGFTVRLHMEPHPYLTVGRRVRIKAGPLAGLNGILLRKKGNYRVVLSIQLIRRSVIADIDIVDIDSRHA